MMRRYKNLTDRQKERLTKFLIGLVLVIISSLGLSGWLDLHRLFSGTKGEFDHASQFIILCIGAGLMWSAARRPKTEGDK